MKSLHVNKGKTIAATIAVRIGYVENPDKTDGGELVTGYECDPRTVDEEFLLSKRQYAYITGRDQGSKNVLAYHIRQSFKPEEISPEDANSIGRELAKRFTKGRHAFIVATHIDKSHVHNHIIFNSTTLDCARKFDDFLRSGRVVRRLSDQICLENGLSIIEDPKLSRGHYGMWLGDRKVPSWREKLRLAINDVIAQKPSDYDAFIRRMQASGYEVKRGKRLAFRAQDQKRFTRCESLGDDYTETAIRERIEGRYITHSSRSNSVGNWGKDAAPTEVSKLNLLIDIQARIQAGKGPGYERWAKVFNLKQAAQTLIFLQENYLTEYEELAREANIAAEKFHDLSAQIKETETRMNNISAVQKHICNYSRTRSVYIQYRKEGYNRKFYEEHEGEILLHQAAKKAFDEQNLKRLPTINELKAEYAALLAGKKKLYQSYRQAKEKMRALMTAKANTDQILRNTPTTPEKETVRS